MDRATLCDEIVMDHPRRQKIVAIVGGGRVQPLSEESWLCYGPGRKQAYKVMLSSGSTYGRVYYCTCGNYLRRRGCVHVEAVKAYLKVEELCRNPQISLFPVSR